MYISYSCENTTYKTTHYQFSLSFESCYLSICRVSRHLIFIAVWLFFLIFVKYWCLPTDWITLKYYSAAYLIFCSQANCIDSTAAPEAVFASEVKKMSAENMKPQEQLTLEPYERDHAVVVGIYRYTNIRLVFLKHILPYTSKYVSFASEQNVSHILKMIQIHVFSPQHNYQGNCCT